MVGLLGKKMITGVIKSGLVLGLSEVFKDVGTCLYYDVKSFVSPQYRKEQNEIAYYRDMVEQKNIEISRLKKESGNTGEEVQ